MRKKLSRNIVITGATGDVAQEIVKRLPDDHLILISRNLSKLKQLYGKGDHVTLLEYSSINQGTLPLVDILINNAGFGVFKPFNEMTDQEIKEQFQANTMLPIQMIQKVKPRIQIINIVSIAGKLPTSKSSIYAASKAALLAFSDALRMEQDLIITTVNTGPIQTKFHENNEAYLKKVGKNVLTADFVAQRIVKSIGKRKREINLPLKMALLTKLRALFPKFIDFMTVKFFDYK